MNLFRLRLTQGTSLEISEGTVEERHGICASQNSMILGDSKASDEEFRVKCTFFSESLIS